MAHFYEKEPLHSLKQGSVYKIKSQPLQLGDADAQITIPLSMSKKPLGTRVTQKAGWVTWYRDHTLSSTSLAQWNAETRSTWLECIKPQVIIQSNSARSSNANVKYSEKDKFEEVSASVEASLSDKPLVLYMFVLLHGMSLPGIMMDSIEHWSAIIQTILANFQPQLESSERLSIVFWAPSYRRQTFISIGSCVGVVLPVLVQELGAAIPVFQKLRLFAMGHSLGGIILRSIFDQRLQELTSPRSSRLKDIYAQLLKFHGLLEDPKVEFEVALTLCSPHAGAYRTKGFVKFPAKVASFILGYSGRMMAQQIRNTDQKHFLKSLAEHEVLGQSWTSSAHVVLENKRGNVNSQNKHDFELQTKVGFKKMVFYGVLKTDWFVAAESALGTAENIEETHVAYEAMQKPMEPQRVYVEPLKSYRRALQVVSKTNKQQRVIAQEELLLLETLPHIERYLVFIPQPGLSTRPHATIKGSPSVIKDDNERQLRQEAKLSLSHIASTILSTLAAGRYRV